MASTKADAITKRNFANDSSYSVGKIAKQIYQKSVPLLRLCLGKRIGGTIFKLILCLLKLRKIKNLLRHQLQRSLLH